MDKLLAEARGAIVMIIANHTPGGISFAALQVQLACHLFGKDHENVSEETLTQALRLERALGTICPTAHGWVSGPLATVLCWDKPPLAQPYADWAAYQADSAPPGTYMPNMSDEWKNRWKAKLLGQRSPRYSRLRVEVRKTVTGGPYAQVLIVVYHDGQVRMSMNGAAHFSKREFAELQLAVTEAREAMRHYERLHPLPQEEAA